MVHVMSTLPRPEQQKWVVASFVVGFLGVCYIAKRALWQTSSGSSDNDDAASTDPGLLKKGSTFKKYTTHSGYTYSGIRTFYHVHPKASKLPEDLPLLVFIHGLGGSAAQFAPLMTSLVNIAPCLAIDLPGCGLSAFNLEDTAAYTTAAFAELLSHAIEHFRNKEVDQKVIIIGHSMGCSISALLASSTSPLAHLSSKSIIAMIAICPRSSPLSAAELAGLKRLSWIPSRLFDLMRLVDRKGGVDSPSVRRVVGKEADLETRKLQLRFNRQSKSHVFQKFCEAIHQQETSALASGRSSSLGRHLWSGISIPLFLVAAEDDKLAPSREANQIRTWLTQSYKSTTDGTANGTPDISIVRTKEIVSGSANDFRPGSDFDRDQTHTITSVEAVVPAEVGSTPEEPNATQTEKRQRTNRPTLILKTSIFPSPSSHGLLYATTDVRILSGLVENFLAKHADVRLSPGWQLQHLTTSGKWDVKNLQKWQSIDPCSAPIGGVFRALKTMREVDDEHCPKEFVRRYGQGPELPDGVAIVVDISHDTPVYDKTGLEAGGIEYCKFPTVSKLPPLADEVTKFNGLIDELRHSPKIALNKSADGISPTIGVHCHYGFNRTGFFLVCYLVERMGWKLQDAIDEFATKRPPGIKHQHFINELFIRYAVKMERRGTVIV